MCGQEGNMYGEEGREGHVRKEGVGGHVQKGRWRGPCTENRKKSGGIKEGEMYGEEVEEGHVQKGKLAKKVEKDMNGKEGGGNQAYTERKMEGDMM